MSHNPPYYAALLEGAGLEKSKDVLAFWMEGRIARASFAVLRIPLVLGH